MEVSKALQVQQSALDLLRVIKVIDDVHTDGVLPFSQVTEDAGVPWKGCYTISSHAISILKPCLKYELSLVHEVGHFLDHRGLAPGQTGFATDDPAASGMSGWLDAVEASKEIRFLRGQDKQKTSIARTGYYLKRAEIWARSYAQWIAEFSKDPALLRAVDHIRTSSDTLFAHTQWSQESFAPISSEIEAMFSKRGWI